MTQGYGPNDGQQGQWGQGDQTPQWGQPEQPAAQPQWGQPSPTQPTSQPQWGQPSPAQPASQPQWGQPSPAQPTSQPQWGQASPAPAAAGYPGAAGYTAAGTGPQFDAGDGVNWRRVKLIGLILLIGTAVLLLVRLGINLASFVGAGDLAASDTGGEIGAVGIGSSLASLVLYVINWVVGLVMFGLGIAAAVIGRARARVGGIIVAVAIPLSVLLYWVFVFVAAILVVAMGMADADTGALTAGGYRVSAVGTALHALLIVAILGLGAFFVHSTASKKLSA